MEEVNRLPGQGSPATESLEGVVERILFANEETHYTVAELTRHKGGGTVVIQGVLPSIQCGETVSALGKWIHHPSYGSQFSVSSYKVMLPSSLHGIRKFLGSGLIPGIGRRYAEKIVDRFGLETLDVLSGNSGRLREIPGIGEKRAADIKRSWDEQRSLRDVMLFLQTYGISVRQCMQIVRKYGASAIPLLRTDPFLLAREIDGIGFKTADSIALNMGLANDSDQRLDAGLLHVVRTLEVQGHTAVARGDLISHASTLLGVGAAAVEDRLRHLVEQRDLVQRGDLLQLPATSRAEGKIADRIRILYSTPSALPSIKIDAAIEWAQAKAGFSFAAEQEEAIRSALTNKVTVLTGGPGTGKTSILRAVVDILKAKKVRICLTSPTGRAALRLSESTGMQAATIHRLLRFDPSQQTFLSDEERPLECDMLIVDESSMLDVRLAAALFGAVPATAHLLIVGDAGQLPSVGAGSVLADLISSSCLPVVRLRQIFRQSGGSPIVQLAHQILEGNTALPMQVTDLRQLPQSEDVVFVSCPTPEHCVDTLVRLTTELLPEMGYDPVNQAQILAPMNRGKVGIASINSAVQGVLNPSGNYISSGDIRFQAGDKIIQIRNDYDKSIFNGDLGRLREVDLEQQIVKATFDEREVEYRKIELSDVLLGYAITIHKSQGSEFPVVIVPLMKQHYMLLQRNLLYTAVTRGKEKVILVGEPEAFRMAVQRKEAYARVTTLSDRLKRALRS